MKNIISELYHGNVHPENTVFTADSEYAGYLKTVTHNQDKLNAVLGDEEKELLTELIAAESDLRCGSEEDAFIKGFRIGARFILDTFVLSLNGFFGNTK